MIACPHFTKATSSVTGILNMDNTLTVAWALPMKAPDACARLEAYTMSKVVITTLKFSLRDSGLCRSWPGIPQEIVNIIAAHIRQQNFEAVVQKWKGCFRCCSGDCTYLDHISAEDLEYLERTCLSVDPREHPTWQYPRVDVSLLDGASRQCQILSALRHTHDASFNGFMFDIGQYRHDSDIARPERKYTFRNCMRVRLS